jgi:predicted DNA-binding transcriptional regulator YafY
LISIFQFLCVLVATLVSMNSMYRCYTSKAVVKHLTELTGKTAMKGSLRDLLNLATNLSASSSGLTMAQMMALTERSRRTVERMLDGLFELGIETEAGQAVGEHHLLKRWRLTKPLPAPLVALEEDERLALEGVALTMQEGPARRALVKLLAAQNTSVAAGVAIDAYTLIDRTTHIGVFGARYVGSETLIGQCERAIVGFEELNISYRKDGEESASKVRVKPLGMLFGRFGYLVGLASGKGVRTYRLNCIEAVELVGKTFTPPAWFNLKAWSADSYGIYHSDAMRSYRIVFSKRVAPRAASIQFHPSQKTKYLADGSLELLLRCRGERELMHELTHPDWLNEVTYTVV